MTCSECDGDGWILWCTSDGFTCATACYPCARADEAWRVLARVIKVANAALMFQSEYERGFEDGRVAEPQRVGRASCTKNCRVSGCRTKSRQLFRVDGVVVRLCQRHVEGPAVRIHDLKRVESDAD